MNNSYFKINSFSKKYSVFLFILFCYLALTPLYWSYGITYELLSIIKLIVFFFIVIVFIFRFKYYDNNVFNFLMLFLFLTFFFSISINGLSINIFSVESHYLFSFFVFYFGFYIVKNKINFFPFIAIPVSIVIIHCFASALDFFISLPISYNNGLIPLHLTGFNLKRTGWSNSVALFLPLIILYFHFYKKNTFLLIFSISIVLASQFFSGGRAGLVSSLLCVAYLFRSHLIKFSIVLFFILIYYMDVFINFFLVSFRVSDADLNETSSFRVEQYLSFFSGFEKYPVFGWGFMGSEDFIYTHLGLSYEMHNVWLRLFLDYGFFHGFLAIIFIFYVLKMINSVKGEVYKVYKAIIYQGLFISLFEPRIIFGSFQSSFIWFLFLGILYGVKVQSQKGNELINISLNENRIYF